jgi:superfamily II DNA or RNA helicase
MTGWNESTLRSAATWKAYKDGKGLLDSGAVTGFKSDGARWSGTVREGKRTYKVSVRVISPTNLEAHCSCADNQSTGAVCSHAVASGLAALGGGQSAAPKATLSSRTTAAAVPTSIPPTTAPPVVAFSIGLPVNWQESLKRGKLAVALSTAGEITPSDARLSEWLVAMGLKPAAHLQLNLDGSTCESFLRAAVAHSRIVVRKTNTQISILEPGIYPAGVPEREGNYVQINVEDDLIQAGEGWFRISENEIVPVGPKLPPAWLKQLLASFNRDRCIRIPVKEFLRRIEQWQEWIEFQPALWLENIQFVPASHDIEVVLDGTLQRLEAKVSVRYGNSEPVPLGLGEIERLPELKGDRCLLRDWSSEKLAARHLVQIGFEAIDSINWIVAGEDSVIRFLSKDLLDLEARWNVAGSDRFKQTRKQVAVIEPKISIVGSGDDWLRFNFSFQSNDGKAFSAADIRQLLVSKRGTGAKKVIISDDASSMIEPLLAELDIRQDADGFTATKRAGEVIRKLCEKLHKNNSINDLAEKIGGANFPSIKASLRSYQTYGASWLIDRVSNYGGALLADDMGLGKTVQAIACIERLIQDSDGLVLIVATTSLLGNWQAELRKFAPHLKVRLLHGNGRETQQERVKSGEVLLTTYGTLPRDLAWYLKQKFAAIVVDEASLMRNPDTDHAKAISRLNADARIALTGTPIENGVRDLWSIFRFIQPDWLGKREDFKQRYELAADDPKVLERLRLKVSPFMLRRTKEQVAPELPSKIFIEEFCDLTVDQKGVYQELLAEGRRRVEEMEDAKNSGAARMRMLTVLLRLRQASCDLALFENEKFKRLSVVRRSAKLQRLLELVEEAISGGHKILIFSQFQKQLREIENSLRDSEISSLRLDGQTRNRQELVDSFQSADGPPVFLISLKAGGYGLNLTAADIVIHFDPWWNPAAEAQATDRAHRIGQTRPVTVYRLIARGTVEEKVVSMQEKKRKVAVAIDDSGGGDAAGWSEAELMTLLDD